MTLAKRAKVNLDLIAIVSLVLTYQVRIMTGFNSIQKINFSKNSPPPKKKKFPGAQWLSGRVLDLRLKGRGFEPHQRHCVVSLSKKINPSLVLVQHRKTRPFIAERLLMGVKNKIK